MSHDSCVRNKLTVDITGLHICKFQKKQKLKYHHFWMAAQYHNAHSNERQHDRGMEYPMRIKKVKISYKTFYVQCIYVYNVLKHEHCEA